ncbi:MAG: hypothetical protein H6975_07525 [Gammaproteobacteria bacterium]|nr:hypothetical protein [Gammaproteobacteria bacterium]
MLKTIAIVPTPHMIELLELIELANRYDAESRLVDYLHQCRRTGYEPPPELLELARDHIANKRRPVTPCVGFRPALATQC